MAVIDAEEPEEKLVVLIPCLNEEALVRRTAEEVLSHAKRIEMPVEVVLIDDGSTDGTRAVMRDICDKHASCRMIAHDVNRGLGAVVMDAYDSIGEGAWVTVFPGDSEYVFGESIDNLLAARHGNDVVLGYLYNPVIRPLGRRVASNAFLRLSNAIYGFRWRSLNGMKLYKVGAFRGLRVKSTGHAYIAELLAKAQLRRPELAISEAPYLARGRGIGHSHAIRPKSVLLALLETWRGSLDVAAFRDTVIREQTEKPNMDRASFFPPRSPE